MSEKWERENHEWLKQNLDNKWGREGSGMPLSSFFLVAYIHSTRSRMTAPRWPPHFSLPGSRCGVYSLYVYGSLYRSPEVLLADNCTIDQLWFKSLRTDHCTLDPPGFGLLLDQLTPSSFCHITIRYILPLKNRCCPQHPNLWPLVQIKVFFFFFFFFNAPPTHTHRAPQVEHFWLHIKKLKNSTILQTGTLFIHSDTWVNTQHWLLQFVKNQVGQWTL